MKDIFQIFKFSFGVFTTVQTLPKLITVNLLYFKHCNLANPTDTDIDCPADEVIIAVNTMIEFG